MSEQTEAREALPAGLTLSDDGQLLNWRGENYVIQRPPLPAPSEEEREALARVLYEHVKDYGATNRTNLVNIVFAEFEAAGWRPPLPAPSEDEREALIQAVKQGRRDRLSANISWANDDSDAMPYPPNEDVFVADAVLRLFASRPTPPEDVVAVDAWWQVAKHIGEQAEGGALDRAMNTIFAALAARPPQAATADGLAGLLHHFGADPQRIEVDGRVVFERTPPEDVAALVEEARSAMRRQEWMPASLAIRMADAIERLAARPLPEKPGRLDPEWRADLVDAATHAIKAVWTDVPGGVDAETLAQNVVSGQEFMWLSRQFPVARPLPETEECRTADALEAKPLGTVVRSAEGDIYERSTVKFSDATFGEQWMSTQSDWGLDARDIALPAAVLYQPIPESEGQG